MIYVVTSAKHQDGKGEAAWEWVGRLAAYVNEHYPEVNVQLVRNISGAGNEGHWMAGYESLAASEELDQKLEADADYQALLAEGDGLWLDSSFVNNLYRTVP